MILYLDTSALVKLIIREDGTADAVAWFERADLIASSVITYAEACSALGQNDRRRAGTPSRLSEWLIALDEHWREVMRVPVAEWPAGKLALAHGLRGMDAVQLAAAITLRESTVLPYSFTVPSTVITLNQSGPLPDAPVELIVLKSAISLL